jgi:hypothetical protein
MEWTTAASLTFRVAKTGYDYRDFINKYWTKLKAEYDFGATQIVITGRSGAGKTQLASHMQGKARDYLVPQPAQESLTVEVYDVTAKNFSKLVRVLPGQTTHRALGVLKEFSNNLDLEGVIHVVDFGYQAPRDSVSSASLIQTEKLVTIEDLRLHNLNEETADLRTMLDDVKKIYLKTKTSPKWIVIAVNKVDLFYPNLKDALAHYHPEGTSKFSKLLSNFQKDIGNANVKIYIMHTCSHEVDFNWNNQIETSKLPRGVRGEIFSSFMDSIAIILGTHK